MGAGWSFQVATRAAGRGSLRPWEDGEGLRPPLHEVPAERADGDQIELLMQEASGTEWVYRRDLRIRRPLEKIAGTSRHGIPVLAPQIALLYKAKAPNARDFDDIEAALLLSPQGGGCPFGRLRSPVLGKPGGTAHGQRRPSAFAALAVDKLGNRHHL